VFVGVDPKAKTLRFDTTGVQLSFDQLSGGEREIGFLIGQIDRFQLRDGLFLIDEPELHLNSDLIRTWVGFLSQTVSKGQVWLATHSLEAAEASGQHSTFVLERNESSRMVGSVARLDERPVLSALSRAVGTPAFSISRLSFVFVEGEESLGERERYRKLTGVPEDVRFLECGSCSEVARRVTAIKSLAQESGLQIRVGGIVDRDFRSSIEADELARKYGIFVLPVHEVENLFLEPNTVTALLSQNGRGEISSEHIVAASADARAGAWIFQYVMATSNAKSLPNFLPAAKERFKSLGWPQFNSGDESFYDSLVSSTGLEGEECNKFRQLLSISFNAYTRKRSEQDLWTVCEGKQILNEIAISCGFSGTMAYQTAAFSYWSRSPENVPREVQALRYYVSNL
jgi:hypothetical protein